MAEELHVVTVKVSRNILIKVSIDQIITVQVFIVS